MAPSGNRPVLRNASTVAFSVYTSWKPLAPPSGTNQDPSAPLEQIAETVGFGSARTLSRAFQRHYGLPCVSPRYSTAISAASARDCTRSHSRQ
ncbi:MAG: AraC family transcriptional regulator [Gammaproteobacteria bacterium]